MANDGLFAPSQIQRPTTVEWLWRDLEGVGFLAAGCEAGGEGDAGELIEGMAAGSWSGGSIWESTEFLAQLLCEMPSDSWGTARVLELGAGCGLLGLAAAGLGAELVVLSDHVRSPPTSVVLTVWAVLN